jgi:hypothetical protein
MKECFKSVNFESLGEYVKTHSKCDPSAEVFTLIQVGFERVLGV